MVNKFQKWENKGQFSFIIPCHKLFKRFDGRYEVDACIDSILDQDYTNYEMIVCANGPDREKIVKHLKKRYKDKEIKYVVTEPANAAIARNAGALQASGEFRSYFSCDLQLLPGALTQWNKAMDENKDASIIYFDIHYVENDEIKMTSNFPAYDRYSHESENCIDGAMPVRAKYDHPWHKDVKALQDWYWSLGVTKKAPAKKIQGIYYLTEVPKEGGLSDYFSSHWKELNTKIKELHNIEKRDTVVTSLAAPAHAIKMAKKIGADYISYGNLAHPDRQYDYEYVFLVGLFPGNMDINAAVLNNGGVKDSARLGQWIGTDVKQMQQISWAANKQIAETLPLICDVQLGSDFLKEELKQMNIQVESFLPLYFDIPKYLGDRGTKKKRVAVYAPGVDENNSAKYNLSLMATVAELLPNVDFSFFGFETDGKLPPFENLSFEGIVDIEKLGKKVDMYVRVLPHDGFGILSVEFLLMGKEVITYPVPIQGAHLGTQYDLSSEVAGRAAAQDLAKRILYILDNPKSDKERREIREFWVDKITSYDIKKEFDKYKKQARKIADQKKKELEDSTS